MSSQVSLSGIDAAFLSLETPSTPMNIVGTLVLDPASAGGGYTYERVLRLVEERLPHLAPFRRRLVAVPFGLDHPVWIDDPDLHAPSHVHRVAVPAPGSERILADLVAQIAAQPLDRTRPLWELWVVEGLAEGRVALVLKLHHAVADGVSATQLLLQLLDSSPEGVDAGESHERVQPDRVPTSRALLGHAFSRLPRAVRALRAAPAGHREIGRGNRPFGARRGCGRTPDADALQCTPDALERCHLASAHGGVWKRTARRREVHQFGVRHHREPRRSHSVHSDSPELPGGPWRCTGYSARGGDPGLVEKPGGAGNVRQPHIRVPRPPPRPPSRSLGAAPRCA